MDLIFDSHYHIEAVLPVVALRVGGVIYAKPKIEGQIFEVTGEASNLSPHGLL